MRFRLYGRNDVFFNLSFWKSRRGMKHLLASTLTEEILRYAQNGEDKRAWNDKHSRLNVFKEGWDIKKGGESFWSARSKLIEEKERGKRRRESSKLRARRRLRWKMGQRPTLPQLKLKYHWRVFVSRPSSEWDRVGPKSYNHPIIHLNRL